MAPLDVSRSNADHFQILSEDRGAVHPRSIVRRPERFEFPAKMLTAVDVKGSKRLIDRSVVEAEELHDLRGRKGITERIVAPDEIELRQPLAEPFTDRGFIAPQDRREASRTAQ